MAQKITGKLRPSQAVTQFGPGALIDLPSLSMIVSSTDEWELGTSLYVDEPRLAERLHVSGFRRPPYRRWSDAVGGIPASVFPKYLRCPRCNRVAHHSKFKFDDSRREAKFVCEEAHRNLSFPPTVFPAKFMVACSDGHLDDFPWSRYVHEKTIDCDSSLELIDTGETGTLSDLLVYCRTHRVRRNIGPAMGANGSDQLGKCSGARPWIRNAAREECDKPTRVLLRGASNAYFPVTESAISVPPWSDPVQIVIASFVETWARIDSEEKLGQWIGLSNEPELNEYSTGQLWEALERRREGTDAGTDVRLEEWDSFRSGNHHRDHKSQFQVRRVDVPNSFSGTIGRLAQVVRLREVRVLRGFTRIDPIPDIGDMGDVEAIDAGMAPVSEEEKNWLPGIDQFGEGIFLELDEGTVKKWEDRAEVKSLGEIHASAQAQWYSDRGMETAHIKPVRYLLLHSLSHLIVRQLGLDCGYASASLRERIYCSNEGEHMAGVLIYTASPDSQGSLGGLVEMAKPSNFESLLTTALRDAHVCASDPLCADRIPVSTGTQLNGAACHACLLESETSCEAGNNYLERAVLSDTIRTNDTAFFN